MKNNIPIILASSSPRRKELLSQLGLTFQIMPSDAEELRRETDPAELAESLAMQKANNIYEKTKKEYNEYAVIGADTIVYYNGEILGKPEDEQEAFDILAMLSDRTHQVYTGVCVIHKGPDGKKIELFHKKTDVTFYPITHYELKEYIASGDPLDKAGAYGIQGSFAKHVREISGDYNNVVGLPIAKLYQVLKGLDLV